MVLSNTCSIILGYLYKQHFQFFVRTGVNIYIYIYVYETRFVALVTNTDGGGLFRLKALYSKVLHSDSLRLATIYIMCRSKAGG